MLKKIKKYLKSHQFDGVLLARSDSFLMDFLPDAGELFLSISGGFTGAPGLVLILKDKNVLFVSNRDEAQAKMQSNFEIIPITSATTLVDYLKEYCGSYKIAYNPKTRSQAWVNFMQKNDVFLTPMTEKSIIDLFGDNEPENVDVFKLDDRFCGESSASKLQKMADFVKKNDIDAYFVASPENVSWLLNQRSLTVLEYPVHFKRGFVDANGVFSDSCDAKRIGLDFANTPAFIVSQLQKNAEIIDIADPIDELKAVKNAVELENIAQTCESESASICRFLAWVEQSKNEITEIDCIQKLHRLRQMDDFYIADSFPAICASGKNASLIHYDADDKTNQKISHHSLLMVDTGGHYLTGTTDMTRTICIDMPTPLMIKRYTQVLKGNIALSTHIFNKDKTLDCLDALARQFLKMDDVDYPHATGHGIGYLLNVHELPPIVTVNGQGKLKSGMLFSNEPGYYSDTEGFGIRLENMLLCVDKNKDEFCFKEMLFIPFDYRLIDENMLTDNEKEFLYYYHQEIKKRIFPLLSEADCDILKPFITFYERFKCQS